MQIELCLREPDQQPVCRAQQLSFSARNGDTEVVKLLLMDPRVDPESFDNYAIKNAHENCFKLLFMDNRINKVFPQYFVFFSGLNILLPEINLFILKLMVLLRRKELNSNTKRSNYY